MSKVNRKTWSFRNGEWRFLSFQWVFFLSNRTQVGLICLLATVIDTVYYVLLHPQQDVCGTRCFKDICCSLARNLVSRIMHGICKKISTEALRTKPNDSRDTSCAVRFIRFHRFPRWFSADSRDSSAWNARKVGITESTMIIPFFITFRFFFLPSFR